jgi:hypothetical protein
LRCDQGFVFQQSGSANGAAKFEPAAVSAFDESPLLRHPADDQIVVTVNEFVAETETQLVMLKPDRTGKATLH